LRHCVLTLPLLPALACVDVFAFGVVLWEMLTW
jgi:hypothetical protein